MRVRRGKVRVPGLSAGGGASRTLRASPPPSPGLPVAAATRDNHARKADAFLRAAARRARPRAVAVLGTYLCPREGFMPLTSFVV
jgi:hypothetical protein